MKALVDSLIIPFIGQQSCPEARNNTSIGYEQTKARKGSSPAWKNSSIEIAWFGASTSKRCTGVPDKERSAAARTYIRWKGLCRNLSVGINRCEASAEENVLYDKINVRSRLSSNVESNPKQTQRSNMGSSPGKWRLKRGGVNCKRRETKSREDGENSALNSMPNSRHHPKMSLHYLCGTQ